MTDASNPSETDTPEIIQGPDVEVIEQTAEEEIDETIDHPAKVMRIGTMLKQLLEGLGA